MPILEVKNLRKEFDLRTSFLAPKKKKVAVDDVSFNVEKGQTLAIVGESGSGKSTVGLMVLNLLKPTSGDILFEGRSVADYAGADRLKFRRSIQVVFQDPFASLNARMQVLELLTEGMVIHSLGASPAEREDKARDLLLRVGLPADALRRYPHEFSGGQRQRIAIARALSVQPSFLVLDEPTSALDVSVQSHVLNLLRELQGEFGLTYLFITHNLGVVEYMANDVCVMQSGKIVEHAGAEALFDEPQHPYTQRLLSAIPSADPTQRKLLTAGAGDV